MIDSSLSISKEGTIVVIGTDEIIFFCTSSVVLAPVAMPTMSFSSIALKFGMRFHTGRFDRSLMREPSLLRRRRLMGWLMLSRHRFATGRPSVAASRVLETSRREVPRAVADSEAYLETSIFEGSLRSL